MGFKRLQLTDILCTVHIPVIKRSTFTLKREFTIFEPEDYYSFFFVQCAEKIQNVELAVSARLANCTSASKSLDRL
jgi:hypothetical protein